MMDTPALAYHVRDRSLLLPLYKRIFVEPLVAILPRRLDPNVITHVGHVANLAALVLLVVAPASARGWSLVVAALVHFYLWCDNADGAHARRTKQCSATGEFLDHGLDLLNATYIACMTVITLGAPPIWSIAAAVVVPAAAAITYWEQAETGVFQLGLFNQIESVFALSLLLALRAVFGSDLVAAKLGPIPLGVALLAFVAATAGVGIARSAWRVAKKGGRVAPFVAPLAFGAAIFAAGATGALGTLAAIVVGAAVFVFLGVRQLALRVRGRRPLVERGVLVAAAAIGGLVVYRTLGGLVGPAIDWTAAIVASICFGGLAMLHAVIGHRAVAALDRG